MVNLKYEKRNGLPLMTDTKPFPLSTRLLHLEKYTEGIGEEKEEEREKRP